MNNPNLAHVAVAECSTRENRKRYKYLSDILSALSGFGECGATATQIAEVVGRERWKSYGYPMEKYNPEYHAPTVQLISQNVRKLVKVGAVQRTEFITGRTLRIQVGRNEWKDIPEKIVLFNVI